MFIKNKVVSYLMKIKNYLIGFYVLLLPVLLFLDISNLRQVSNKSLIVILLSIIVIFSIVGVIKTFENDLIYYFPEVEYFLELLNLQLEYFSETFKNMIIIVKDLIDSY